jgi:hypothetical protein
MVHWSRKAISRAVMERGIGFVATVSEIAADLARVESVAQARGMMMGGLIWASCSQGAVTI